MVATAVSVVQETVDPNSLSSMMTVLHRKTVNTLAYSHLLSIVYHCLLLPRESRSHTPHHHTLHTSTHSTHSAVTPLLTSMHSTNPPLPHAPHSHPTPTLAVDDPLYAKYWHLIDRLVQQVVIQQQQGVDPDHAPVPIDVDNLVQKLVQLLIARFTD